MTTYNWLMLAIMACGFIGNAAYVKGAFGEKFRSCEKRLDDIEDDVRYKDTCDSKHEAVDQRLGRLEKNENGKTK